MQRLIMTSETYKMASAFYQPTDLEKDPTNVYLWRFPVHRMEAEIIRDAMLDASGDLNLQAGGPAFFPSIPRVGARGSAARTLGAYEGRAGHLETQRLRLRQARPQVPDVRGLRCARSEHHLRAACCQHRSDSGADDAE